MAITDVTLGQRIGVTDQYLRSWRLIMFNEGGATSVLLGLPQFDADTLAGEPWGTTGQTVLSSDGITGTNVGAMTYAGGLRIVFNVTKNIHQTPNTAEITIYNLKDRSVDSLIGEYNFVILQAGYQFGVTGTIFAGTIKMYKKGHDNATDSYLKIYAADGDQAITSARINKTLPAGTTLLTKLQTLFSTMHEYHVNEGNIDFKALVTPPNMSKEALWGMTSDRLRDFSNQQNAIWYVLNQRYYWAKPQSYDASRTVVQLTARTGLVGFPEQTPDGINITCLINPRIDIRQRIHIDNALINQYLHPPEDVTGTWTTGPSGGWFNLYPGNMVYYAPTVADGIYAAIQISYEGDSRGGPWLMHIVALGVDSSKDDPLFAILGGFGWNSITG